MPVFKLTAKRSIGANDVPKGTTFQVITPSGINTLDQNKIKAALKQQLGIDLSKASYSISTSDFDIVKL